MRIIFIVALCFLSAFALQGQTIVLNETEVVDELEMKTTDGQRTRAIGAFTVADNIYLLEYAEKNGLVRNYQVLKLGMDGAILNKTIVKVPAKCTYLKYFYRNGVIELCLLQAPVETQRSLIVYRFPLESPSNPKTFNPLPEMYIMDKLLTPLIKPNSVKYSEQDGTYTVGRHTDITGKGKFMVQSITLSRFDSNWTPVQEMTVTYEFQSAAQMAWNDELIDFDINTEKDKAILVLERFLPIHPKSGYYGTYRAPFVLIGKETKVTKPHFFYSDFPGLARCPSIMRQGIDFYLLCPSPLGVDTRLLDMDFGIDALNLSELSELPQSQGLGSHQSMRWCELGSRNDTSAVLIAWEHADYRTSSVRETAVALLNNDKDAFSIYYITSLEYGQSSPYSMEPAPVQLVDGKYILALGTKGVAISSFSWKGMDSTYIANLTEDWKAQHDLPGFKITRFEKFKPPTKAGSDFLVYSEVFLLPESKALCLWQNGAEQHIFMVDYEVKP